MTKDEALKVLLETISKVLPISLISKDTFNVAKYYPYWMPIHEVEHDQV